MLRDQQVLSTFVNLPSGNIELRNSLFPTWIEGWSLHRDLLVGMIVQLSFSLLDVIFLSSICGTFISRFNDNINILWEVAAGYSFLSQEVVCTLFSFIHLQLVYHIHPNLPDVCFNGNISTFGRHLCSRGTKLRLSLSFSVIALLIFIYKEFFQA